MAGDGEIANGQLKSETKTAGHIKLERWLNKNMKIKMTDGRTLIGWLEYVRNTLIDLGMFNLWVDQEIGIFVCTDRDRNVILGSCHEYLKTPETTGKEEPRVLGLAMVPGHHIISICIDETQNSDDVL